MTSVVKRRKQNHKISFHFFAAPPCTPRLLNGLVRKFLVLVREWKEREVRIVSHHHEIRAYDLVQSHHALRACEVNQNPADFVHKEFELRPRNTAMIQENGFSYPIEASLSDGLGFEGRKRFTIL